MDMIAFCIILFNMSITVKINKSDIKRIQHFVIKLVKRPSIELSLSIYGCIRVAYPQNTNEGFYSSIETVVDTK